MDKLVNYVMLTVGIMLLFNLAGFITTSGYILNQLGFNLAQYENNATNNPTDTISNFALFSSGNQTSQGVATPTASTQSSPFFQSMVLVIGLVTGVGIVASLISGGNFSLDTISSALLSFTFALFLTDFISIIVYVGSGEKWISYLIAIVGIPIVFGFAITIINYVFNRNN